jgi:hypothetical protein
MTVRPQRSDDLLVSENFIRAVREAGYLSVSTAIAELIDNSLEAKASDVSITIGRSAKTGLPDIQVEDNGIGMNSKELAACLKFGGSSRFGGDGMFGRFGMGLPSASLSQTRHVDVTAWQRGSRALTVSLDVDKITAGVPADLAPRAEQSSAGESGCRVHWFDCDRVEYQRLAWLERSLHRDLGRMYRRFLSTGLRLTINDILVEPVDPTLLTTAWAGRQAQLAFEPIRYEVATGVTTTSFVTVRFSVLPVEHWHALDNVTKKRIGIVGQGGVSILRAGREIALGWHLMGSKRKENYDDWWRCEIEFEPDLDDQFGITNNKQGVRPSRALRDALEPELESIARMLNGRVRQSFEEVKFKDAAAESCRIAERSEQDLPVLKGRSQLHGPVRYEIKSAPLPVDLMFKIELSDRTLTVVMNVDHPAYRALYQPLEDQENPRSSEMRIALELLIISYARSGLESESPEYDHLRTWSSTYGRMLQRS